MLDIGAVISDRAVNIRSTAHQVTQFAAEAVADRADLAVALRQLGQKVPCVLHVARGEVVIEIVIEIECLFDVLGIAVGKLDAGLLTPKQIGHETDTPPIAVSA